MSGLDQLNICWSLSLLSNSSSVDMRVIKEKKKYIVNLLNLTIFYFFFVVNLGAFLQCRRWEWIFGVETEVCPKGSFRRTKGEGPAVSYT